jgi:hypothetical protein
MRAKALVEHPSDEDSRYLYERVGEIVSPSPIPVRVSKKVPCSGIFIGADLDPGEILRVSQEYLHPDCQFADL